MMKATSILVLFAACLHNLPHAHAADHGRQNILDLAQSMLAGSSLTYNYATLRKAARDKIKKEGIDSLNTPALIITDDGSQETGKAQFLKYPITAAAMEKFVDLNKKFVEGIKGLEHNKNSPYYFPNVLNHIKQTDGEIREFDDQFARKDLVYALTINKSNKRITLCFRGSVTWRDWRSNLGMVR
jgi:hypothetical protein